ncbi:unnamed protein product [Durusdinium trenchii]|uniref:Zeta_toxin domain-containing protein n=2 Tax=Durusdinium trenchii TaxID=1381693 RepID=A0ABP0RU05_9DINO
MYGAVALPSRQMFEFGHALFVSHERPLKSECWPDATGCFSPPSGRCFWAAAVVTGLVAKKPRESFKLLRRARQTAEILQTTDCDDVAALRQVFHSVTEGEALQKEDFVKLCQSLLHIDLTFRELERIFDIVVFGEGEHRMTEDVFIRTIRNRFFLKNIRCVVQLQRPQNWKLPEGYSLDMDTAQNHYSENSDFVGPYADIRATRDHAFHGRYSEERQRWQDSVINTVVQRTTEQARPRLVFTCGAMGVGKGYALGWLSNRGIFPLEDIVHIDPDHFKQVMPEWSSYVEHGKKLKDPSIPGNRCHRESCYMQEIALEESLKRQQHIWVDGSLRNAEWFVNVFSGIRERYPAYQIAIFKITAPEEIIRNRVCRRAQQTGRSIPEATLKASLAAVERSVLTLMPHADFIASMDNSEKSPKLQYFAAIDRSGSWKRITARFAHTLPGLEAFPDALAPFFQLRVEKCPRLEPATSLQCRCDGEVESQFGVLTVKGLQVQVKLSPVIRLTLDPETRRLADIHERAVSVAFMHPALEESGIKHRDMSNLTESEHQALTNGAFAMFSLDDTLVALNAVSCRTNAQEPKMLEFGPAAKVTPEEAKDLDPSRWAKVKMQHIKDAGVERFAFYTPLERLAGRRISASSGFIFEVEPGEEYTFFPIIASYDG